MKNFLAIIFFIFGQVMSAQKFSGFYIEPTVGAKVNTTKKSTIPLPLVTDYFTIKQTQTLEPDRLFIGLNVGYTFKNNDKLQFGVCQDGSLQGHEVSGLYAGSSEPVTLYVGRLSSDGHAGTSYLNYSLVYKRSVLNITSRWLNKDRFIRVHVNMGLSYIYKPNDIFNRNGGPNRLSYIAEDSSRVNIEINSYNAPTVFSRSFKLNLGLDFTFGRKDREWCNFNISFISNRTGRTSFSYTQIRASVENKKGTTKYYYVMNGSGNGLYFTLSKRIYPIKMYQRNVAKRIEKYNQLKG
jgi:hypothetical protein